MGSLGNQLGRDSLVFPWSSVCLSPRFSRLLPLLIIRYRVLWATIRWGEELRAYVDVGYSTITET